MTAQIIHLHPDRYIPLRFEVPPEEAVQAKADYNLATIVREFADQMRNTIFQRGEPLEPEERMKLVMMHRAMRAQPNP